MKVLRPLADRRDPRSLSAVLRRRRFAHFAALLARVPSPLWILDVGGESSFWKQHENELPPGAQIVLVNLQHETPDSSRISFVEGDARDLSQFRDGEFDVVFSNSVIEHVGSHDDQRRMASEIARVGKRYYVQTPAKSFPVEPHFLFPFFASLPLGVRVGMLRRFDLGWLTRTRDANEARRIVESVRLLTRRELEQLFPGASIDRERFAGLTKSYLVHKGF